MEYYSIEDFRVDADQYKGRTLQIKKSGDKVYPSAIGEFVELTDNRMIIVSIITNNYIEIKFHSKPCLIIVIKDISW